MTYNIKGVKVIDGYFPDWIVDDVAQWLTEYCPMYYNNAPYGDYKQTRFWGNTVIRDDNFSDTSPYYWFFSYFCECIKKDICRDKPISHIHRLLVNAQSPDMESQLHDDRHIPATSVIYHAFGESGDTEFATGDRVRFRQGRIIVFDSSLIHKGNPPYVHDRMRISLGAIADHKDNSPSITTQGGYSANG